MAQSDIWFPLYVGDYLADTMHLDRGEHGAYFLLLLAYYKNQGPLPDDDKKLANIVKETVTVWLCLRSAMTKFFKIEGGKWVHPRADREISRRKSVQAARQQAAARTNATLGRGSVSDTVTDTVTDTLRGVQSQSQSHKEGGRENGAPRRPPVSGNGQGKFSGSESIRREKELHRVEKEMDWLRAKHREEKWSEEARCRINLLKTRREELKKLLGFVA